MAHNRAMRVDAAIIGGTGIGDRLREFGGRPVGVSTADGRLRGTLTEIDGASVMLLKRHSAGHKVPPHRVDYRAMARGLAELGCPICFATAAVGCLRREWGPGTLVVCRDFLDVTGRNPTLFDRTVVHVDFSNPFGPRARAALLGSAEEAGIAAVDGGVYMTANGPRYETPAEIALYGRWGADLVGMTAGTEAILMREAGIEYGCLALVTNLAAGLSEKPLSHEEVVEEMERSGEKALAVLRGAVRRVAG